MSCRSIHSIIFCMLLLSTSMAAFGAQQISHGRFENVTMYEPRGEVRQFVLMLSGDAGWTPAMARMAETSSQEGALVAGIDVPRLFKDFEQDDTVSHAEFRPHPRNEVAGRPSLRWELQPARENHS